MAIQNQIWVADIVENLFPANEVISKVSDDGAYVLGGRTVNIPQAGAKPSVVVNRNTFPATATKRTDTVISYDLDSYTTDPVHVQITEETELSYDKRKSILGQHIETLREKSTDAMLIKWLANAVAAGKIIRTTGANAAATETGQTGTRKVLTLADLRGAKTLMNKQNISKMGRFACIESNMLDQLVAELSATQYRDFSERVDSANGILGRIEGFDILDRSFVGISNVGATAIDAIGATVDATDQLCSFIFQKDSLAKAIGAIDVFYEEKSPLYFGDIMSTEMRCGGRVKREDALGVFALIQATGA